MTKHLKISDTELEFRRNAGATYRELAKIAGSKLHTIYGKLDRLGVPRRRHWAKPKPPKPPYIPPVKNMERRARAAELRSQGLTLTRIGAEMGVTKERARQYLKDLEVSSEV